jgi:KaiC/GvpD/RAD55 family RecA-like ATPase
MTAETNYLVITSLVISIFAAAISIVRYRNERVRRQAATVGAYYDIVKLIDNDRAVESRGLLRANAELNCLKDVDPDSDDVHVPEVDNKILEAARYVATTYDRLGFILKHDPKLEQEILDWNADVIADMWRMTRLLVKKKWRMRNPQYAREFERLAEKAIAHMEQMQQQK